ncbi:MAG: acyl carrier protein [Nitrospirae bacterium]|jgi:acyl carrier protein|nr:acyl carrier protein [Nitrospirota bacterium]
MTLQNIQDKLIQGIAAITAKDESSIAPDVPFHKLGIDSLGFVEILVFIEKTFNLQLIESGLDKKDFETIRSLAAFIHKKL